METTSFLHKATLNYRRSEDLNLMGVLHYKYLVLLQNEGMINLLL